MSLPSSPILAQQTLVKGEESLVDLKDVVVPVVMRYSTMISNLLAWEKA